MKKILIMSFACIAVSSFGSPTVLTDLNVTGSVTASTVVATSRITIGTNTAPVSSTGATGTVAAAAAVGIKDGETVTINDQTYTFQTNTLTAVNQILIEVAGENVGTAGHTNSVAMSNLFLAVTSGTDTNNTMYYTGTAQPANVTITKVDNSTIRATANAGYHGPVGRLIPLARTGAAEANGTNMTVSAATLLGGIAGTPADAGTMIIAGTSFYINGSVAITNNATWTTK